MTSTNDTNPTTNIAQELPSEGVRIGEEEEVSATIMPLSSVNEMLFDADDIDLMPPVDEEDDGDPLSDPLALDTSIGDHINRIVETISDDFSNSNEIIIVDVQSLTRVDDDVPHNMANGSVTILDTDEVYDSSLPPEETPCDDCVRSDGSDSGMGSETSANLLPLNIRPMISDLVPSRSNLKRRQPVDDDDVDGLIEGKMVVKKAKRNLSFGGVTIYYFQRMQGFGCVPSQGGCTLGMASHHMHIRQFSLAEHAAEQRRAHRQKQQELNPKYGSSSEESDTDEEQSVDSSSELDTESNGFLQPVPQRQRRNLLKQAGIRKIDLLEKDECRMIRTSREFCGCNCRGFCDPDTCSCSQGGIKCQVDRPNFPCGCSRDGCSNVVGRVEFNPTRVRTHFIHTIYRLELENKQNHHSAIDDSNMMSMMMATTSKTAAAGTSGELATAATTIPNLFNPRVYVEPINLNDNLRKSLFLQQYNSDSGGVGGGGGRTINDNMLTVLDPLDTIDGGHSSSINSTISSSLNHNRNVVHLENNNFTDLQFGYANSYESDNLSLIDSPSMLSTPTLHKDSSSSIYTMSFNEFEANHNPETDSFSTSDYSHSTYSTPSTLPYIVKEIVNNGGDLDTPKIETSSSSYQQFYSVVESRTNCSTFETSCSTADTSYTSVNTTTTTLDSTVNECVGYKDKSKLDIESAKSKIDSDDEQSSLAVDKIVNVFNQQENINSENACEMTSDEDAVNDDPITTETSSHRNDTSAEHNLDELIEPNNVPA